MDTLTHSGRTLADQCLADLRLVEKAFRQIKENLPGEVFETETMRNAFRGAFSLPALDDGHYAATPEEQGWIKDLAGVCYASGCLVPEMAAAHPVAKAILRAVIGPDVCGSLGAMNFTYDDMAAWPKDRPPFFARIRTYGLIAGSMAARPAEPETVPTSPPRGTSLSGAAPG